MWIGTVSLFPEMFAAVTEQGVVGRAVSEGRLQVAHWNPRDFTTDRHRTVDDRPFGGGPGMLMKPEPLHAAISAARSAAPAGVRTLYMSPQGQPLTQAAVAEFATRPGLILVCGRYEGVDERLLEAEIDEQWSLGDFVLSGGELAAMCVLDAVGRLLPGVLNHAESAVAESFVTGLLDTPHYTRPEQWDERSVPEVLRSGDHAAIAQWRLKQSLGRTWLRRPDLLAQHPCTAEEQRLLAEFQREWTAQQSKQQE